MAGLSSRRAFLKAALAAGAGACCAGTGPAASARSSTLPPNIVIILADDLGLGDVGCYNPTSTIPTPHMDRLAAEGMRFTDAHSAGAVCVPARYGLLTGRYYWRGENRGLNGYSKNVVEPEQVTLAELLRTEDYHTNCIGKWHLGLGEQEPADFSKPLIPNPTTHGFDYFFGLPASLDFPPYCYVENARAVTPPTEQIAGTAHRTGGFFREGAIAPGFRHDQALPQLTEMAVQTIQTHAALRAAQPLFLYFALTAPHTPWAPVAGVKGKTGVGDYGDFVHQTDQSLGAILDALEKTGMDSNTVVIFASDNGGLQSWLPEGFSHKMNLDFRGQKGDVWEGGHRVPLIVRWPGQVAAGTSSEALVSLKDLYRTCASITGAQIPEGAAVDSVDMLPVLRGGEGTRECMVHESISGIVSLREGDWKLILGLGGGGLGFKPEEHQPEPGGPTGQLYNLAEDPGEQRNLFLERPEVVARMSEKLQAIRTS